MAIVVSASEIAPYSSLSEVVDSVTTTSHKWFSLQDNKLDGSFHPIPSNNPAYKHISTLSSSFEECSGKLIGDPAKDNGTNILDIGGGGWRFSMHFSPATDFCEIMTDGGKFGNNYARIYHTSPANWKALTSSGTGIDFAANPGKWYRASVWARTSVQNGRVSGYLLYNGSNPMTTSVSGNLQKDVWTKLEARVQVPASGMVGTPNVYLYGSEGGVDNFDGYTDWDGYHIEGPFNTDPGNSDTQIGWWGTTVSDVDGYTAGRRPPALTVDYGTITPIYSLQVAGDPLLGEYPTDFKVEVYNGATIVYTETVTSNNQSYWKKNLTQIYDATKLILTVTRLNKANRTVKITEFQNLFEIIRSDSLSFDSTESSIAVSLFEDKFSTDDLIIDDHISESIQITASMSKVDTLTVSDDVESDQITAYIYSYDSLVLGGTDVGAVTNIHTRMEEDTRKIYGKVEITYSDPFLDASIVATANETGRFTNPKQTADNLTTTRFKWFSLHDNKLDGSYHPLSTDPDISIGWWGNSLSDVEGFFDEFAQGLPELTVNFDARSIFNLRVVGDDANGNYPVDFNVDLLNAANAVIYTEVVTGNTEVLWTKELVPINSVTGIRLTVTKISKPYQVVRIVEFYSAVQEIYLDDDIMSIHLLEEQMFESQTLPIGNISANELDIHLENRNGRFDAANKLSPLYGMLRKNRRVRAWLGAEIIPGDIEWHPLGVFWTVDWNAPRNSNYVSTSARDRLELLRTTDFTKSLVYVNITLKALALIVLQDAGLKPEDYDVDDALDLIVVPYAWFDRGSHRAALAKIAATGLARVYCNRLGQIVMESFKTQPFPMYKYTEEDSLFDIDHPLMWSQIVNYVEVKVQPRTLGPLEDVYSQSSADAIEVPANGTITEIINFNTIPATGATTPTFTATGVTLTKVDFYAWGAEVTFTNTTGTPQPITNLNIKGKVLNVVGAKVVVAQDINSIRDNNKQKYPIDDNDFIQDNTLAQTITGNILSVYKDPRHDVKLNTPGHIALALGDRISAPNYGGADNTDYTLIRQDITWEGFLISSVEGQKIVGG